MSIRFSRHANLQIKDRNIAKNKIVAGITKPDHTIQQSIDRFRAIKKISISRQTYLLIIVYNKVGLNIKVITAFITSKIKKYETTIR